MQTQRFTFRSRLPVSAAAAFAWHERPGAFVRLTPPWERVRLVSHQGIRNGHRAVLELSFGPMRRRWIAEHSEYEFPRRFRDSQVEGPFAFWQHTHTILPSGIGNCWLQDQIEYAVPLGRIGEAIGGRAIRRTLARMFAYRHRVLGDDLHAHAKYEATGMKVLISGRRGLIGSELAAFLSAGGHDVAGLSRQEAAPGRIHWNPESGQLDTADLAGFDVVVHLAGETIAARWSAVQKRKIRDSRVNGTRLLCERLAQLDDPPKVLVCASAVGYYGDRGDEVLTEESSAGEGFLADVCREWEAAADPARTKGIRVVHLRTGVVLSPKGGALPKMLTPFKLGAGGVVGDGSQYWSWVALDDVVGAIHHAIMTESLEGPVNVTAPNPCSNREFTRALGRVLGRPTIIPLPAFAARLALGEMADELLLSSARALPRKLEASGYRFRHPQLDEALRTCLGR